MWKDFLVEHDAALQRLCNKMSRMNHAYAGDLYNEVVLERLPRICELWTPCKGPLYNYAMRNLRWYMFKWMNGRHSHQELLKDVVHYSTHEVELEHKDRVYQLLKGLSEYDQWLLWTKAQGFTFEEIGAAAGCCKVTARNRYLRALARARRAAGQ